MGELRLRRSRTGSLRRSLKREKSIMKGRWLNSVDWRTGTRNLCFILGKIECWKFYWYFASDQVNADLAEPSLRFGWRTAAIIPELEKEIAVFEGSKFKLLVHRLNELEFEYHKAADRDSYCGSAAQKLLKERRDIKVKKFIIWESPPKNFRTIWKKLLLRRLARSSAQIFQEPTTPVKWNDTPSCTLLQSEIWTKWTSTGPSFLLDWRSATTTDSTPCGCFLTKNFSERNQQVPTKTKLSISLPLFFKLRLFFYVYIFLELFSIISTDLFCNYYLI